MSPITRIALRRIKQNWHKSIFLMFAILFSMLMISFFLFFELQTLSIEDQIYNDLPLTEFMATVRSCMNITIAFLICITFLTVRTHCSIRNEDNVHILAVLTSVGAGNHHRRKLVWIDILILYIPPTVVGVLLGIIPGISIGSHFLGASVMPTTEYIQYVIVASIVIAAGILLILLCNFLPNIQWRKRSVIQSVKKQNRKVSEQKHSYRQSQTYKNQVLLKRLAKKSIDYYSKTYNSIALTFALAALYPILAALLFWYIGNTDIVFDTNQDVIAAMITAIDNILLFLGGCFLVLTFVGVMQVVLMMRVQIAARKKSARIYLSIGMLEADIHKMIRHELTGVLLRSFIILIFATYIVNACFGIIIGAW